MDKMAVLRCLTSTDFFQLLSNGELKLYLLLLVNASEFDTVEKINLKQIGKANGKMPCLSELKAMMASLERHGLAVTEQVTGHPPQAGSSLRFRLRKPYGHIEEKAVNPVRPLVSYGVNKKYDRRIKWQKS